MLYNSNNNKNQGKTENKRAKGGFSFVFLATPTRTPSFFPSPHLPTPSTLSAPATQNPNLARAKEREEAS